jgi:VWFA-related protein
MRIVDRRRSLWAAGLMLGLSSAVALVAQAPPSTRVADSIQVNVVNLDVFVTDKNGQPMTGLTKEDFEILEDSKPVPITNFYAENRAEAPKEAAATSAAPKVADRPLDQRLRLVVYVDDVNLSAATRDNILGKVSEFLHRELVPGDEVMLVRYDLKLDIRRAFTADLAQVDSDLAAISQLSSDIRKFEQSRRQALEDIIGSMEGDIYEPALVETRLMAWGEQESGVIKRTLTALDSVVSWLAGVPGRKAILYVSDGLALAPGHDLFAAFADGPRGVTGISITERITPFRDQSLDLSKRFRETTAHAGRNGIAIYPIEAYGVRGARGSRAQNAAVQSRQNGLRLLAEETGGQALLNAAQPLVALAPLAQDLASYYSLGYQPQRQGDELEHRIEVRVKPKGAQVRYRRWYRDKPVDEKIAERTLAVMRFGPEDNPLGARLDVLPGKKQGETRVQVRVPVSKLYLQDNEDEETTKKQAQVRVYLVVGGEGTLTPVRKTPLGTVEVSDTPGAPRQYVREITVNLPAGSYTLGVGLQDELAAATSYLRKDFVVRPAAVAAPLSPSETRPETVRPGSPPARSSGSAPTPPPTPPAAAPAPPPPGRGARR